MLTSQIMTSTARHHTRPLALCLLALTLACSAAPVSAQTTAAWINPAGGDWNDPANWSTGNYPSGSAYDAELGTLTEPYVVSVDGEYTINQLRLLDDSSTLRVSGSVDYFTAEKGVINNGLIEIIHGGYLAIGKSSLGSGADLMGTGEVIFQDNLNPNGVTYGQRLYFHADLTNPQIGPGVTVRALGGPGDITALGTGATNLTNYGTLWADGQTLHVNYSVRLNNMGLLRAGGGGTLRATIYGLAGDIQIDPNGTVELIGPNFNINKSVVIDPDRTLSLDGDWTIEPGQSIILNGGRLLIHEDRPDNARIQVNSGTLGLGFDLDWASFLDYIHPNVDTAEVVRYGELQLGGASINLPDLPFSLGMAGGVIRDGQILRGDGSRLINTNGGVLNGITTDADVFVEDELMISDSYFANSRLSGPGKIRFFSTYSDNHLDHVTLDVDWYGKLTVSNGLTVYGIRDISNGMTFEGTQTIDGSGQLIVNGRLSPIQNGRPTVIDVVNGDLTVGENLSLLIADWGLDLQVPGGSVVFRGDIYTEKALPGTPTLPGEINSASITADRVEHQGLVHLNGRPLRITANTWSLTDSATLEADLDLAWPTLIDVTGVAELDGELVLTVDPEWTPQIGESITLVAAVGGINGYFDSVRMPGGLSLEYTPTGLTVSVRHEGDLNGDGFVGIADLNVILATWNQSVPAGVWSGGDVTGDGFVGIEDLNAVLGSWNTGVPPTNVAVPEPAGFGLLLAGSLALLRRAG